MHRLQEPVRLARMGVGCRQRARLLKMSANTERNYRRALKEEGLLQGPEDSLPELATLRAAVLKYKPAPEPTQQTSSVDLWIDHIERLVKKGNQATAIHDYLRMTFGQRHGSLSVELRNYVMQRLVRAANNRRTPRAFASLTLALTRCRDGALRRLRPRFPFFIAWPRTQGWFHAKDAPNRFPGCLAPCDEQRPAGNPPSVTASIAASGGTSPTLEEWMQRARFWLDSHDHLPAPDTDESANPTPDSADEHS